MTDKVILDVGGQRFVTSLKSLQSLPRTKLGQLALSPENSAIEFYFDRNAEIFQFILDFYRTGELHMPLNVCARAFKMELDYWEISEKSILLCAGCCKKYFSESDEEKTEAMKSFAMLEHVPLPSNCQTNTWRKKLWLLLDDPSSSHWAKIPAGVYLLVSVLCILITVTETVEGMRSPYDNVTTAYLESKIEFANGTKLRTKLLTTFMPGLVYVYFACVGYFAIDCFVRFIVCPFREKFFKSLFNVLDFFIVFPLIIGLLFGNILDPDSLLSEFSVICFLSLDAVIRVLMVIRLLKFYRNHIGLKVLFLTIKSSLPVFGVLISFMAIATLLFALLIYIASIRDDTYFSNAFYGMWWAIVTMTTVGYGDMYPVTPSGYVVGVLCALTGIILTSLPIAVLGNSFNTYLQYAKEYEMMKKSTIKMHA